jgi:hypothetical protein
MVFVWGHNNFCIKSVKPIDLGIIENNYDNITFELRQKYGHLFYIPFIPLGKMWVVNKHDGQFYQYLKKLNHS